MNEIRAIKEGTEFPLSFARVNCANVLMKTGKDVYENCTKTGFFSMMKKTVVVAKTEEVVFAEQGQGEISSIVLPSCEEAVVNIEVDNQSYRFVLKTDKSEQQRCVIGFSLTDVDGCEKLSVIRERYYPDHMCAVEVVSVTKAKQLGLPVLKFSKRCRVTLKCTGIRPKQLGAHAGINYLLLNDFI